MRSCEYVKVQQQEKRRTENIHFFKNGRLIKHEDATLEYSDCICITFEMQRKKKRTTQ
jgi:hypothetical protein